MQFKFNLSNEELELIKMKADSKAKITCYCDLSQESGSVIFPQNSSILYNDAIISNSSKLTYIKDGDYQGFLLYDKYDNVILTILDRNLQNFIVIKKIDTNIYSMILQEIQIPKSLKSLHQNPIKYPIFSREIKNIDGYNVGRLYASFSPLTPESKYIIQEVTGSTHYINSVFDVFEEDSNFTLFNYLGLGIGETFVKVTESMDCLDVLLLYKLEDFCIVFISKSGESCCVPYTELVNSAYNNAYLIAKSNCLVYSDSDKFVNVELGDDKEEIIDELSSLGSSSLEYTNLLQDLDNIINSNIRMTDEDKEFWSVKVSLAIAAYDKLSSMKVFELYDILIYITKDNKVSIISELEEFYNNIQEVLKML